MPRQSKGARLWLRAERKDAAGKSHPARWVIRDGGSQRVTRFGPQDREDAERALADYIAAKYEPPRRERPTSAVRVSDVIGIYLRDVAPRQARPGKVGERAVRLLEYWGEMTLADVSAATVAEYVRRRGKSGGARRDLEDLRAAIKHHAAENLHRGEVRIVLPEKGAPRDRWLTRTEAARLLWAAWRAREVQNRSHKGGQGPSLPTRKWTMRHLTRFILLGLYTGTRAGAIASASWEAASGRSYVDLDQGLFYRRRQGAKETTKRQPPVPIPSRLLAHMRRWKAADDGSGYVVEYHGQPVRSVKTAFARAVLLAGLGGKITPHTLRHTACTWAMQRGVSAWYAAGLLGMSRAMVDRVYAHHAPDYLRGAAEALASRPGATTAPQIRRT